MARDWEGVLEAERVRPMMWWDERVVLDLRRPGRAVMRALPVLPVAPTMRIEGAILDEIV